MLFKSYYAASSGGSLLKDNPIRMLRHKLEMVLKPGMGMGIRLDIQLSTLLPDITTLRFYRTEWRNVSLVNIYHGVVLCLSMLMAIKHTIQWWFDVTRHPLINCWWQLICVFNLQNHFLRGLQLPKIIQTCTLGRENYSGHVRQNMPIDVWHFATNPTTAQTRNESYRNSNIKSIGCNYRLRPQWTWICSKNFYHFIKLKLNFIKEEAVSRFCKWVL